MRNSRLSNARLERVVKRRSEREDAAQRATVGSIVRNLGLMGLLGWLFVTPPLLFGFLGRWLDHSLGSGIQLTGGLLMLGLGVGSWLVWRRIRDTGIFRPGDGP